MPQARPVNNSQIRSMAWREPKISAEPFPQRSFGMGLWDGMGSPSGCPIRFCLEGKGLEGNISRCPVAAGITPRENSLIAAGASSPQTLGTTMGVSWPRARLLCRAGGSGIIQIQRSGGIPAEENRESRGWDQQQSPPGPKPPAERQSQAEFSLFWHPAAGKYGRDEPLSCFSWSLERCLSPPGTAGQITGLKLGCARPTPPGTGRQLQVRQLRPGVRGDFIQIPPNSRCFRRFKTGGFWYKRVPLPAANTDKIPLGFLTSLGVFPSPSAPTLYRSYISRFPGRQRSE